MAGTFKNSTFETALGFCISFNVTDVGHYDVKISNEGKKVSMSKVLEASM